jgi:hypothetical protein
MRCFPPFENLYEHDLGRTNDLQELIADQLERPFKYLWAPLAPFRIDICWGHGVGMRFGSETRCGGEIVTAGSDFPLFSSTLYFSLLLQVFVGITEVGRWHHREGVFDDKCEFT